VMSIVAMPAMLGPILGPTISGLILDNERWRSSARAAAAEDRAA
jgi:MFS family permease